MKSNNRFRNMCFRPVSNHWSLITFTLLFLIMTSCQSEDKTPLLIGTWKGVSWKVGDKNSGRNASNARFQFNADDTYTAAFEGSKEKGTFRLRGDGKLFTTAEGNTKIEKAVQLAKITTDTLVMKMNRVGDREELILVKVK